jgi:PAS domain S-box-containing protein
MANIFQENERLMVELESLRSQINFLRSQRFERLFVETETLNINSQDALEIILRESEERFLCIADNTPALIWMAGLDKGCFYFNQPWLKFTGRTLEQEQGNGWTAGIHPDDFDYCWQTYSRAFDRRKPFTVEYRLRDATGGYRYLLENGVPRFAQNGRFLGYIGSCIDITDRQEARQEIEKSEEKYRTLIESIGSIVICWQPTGKITFVNRYGLLFFGFSEEEIIGKNVIDTIVPKVSSTGKDLEAYIGDICKSPEKYEFLDNENVKKNGERVWITWTNKPVFDDRGNVIEMFAVGTDITARKLAEDQLRQRELELLETQKLAKLGRWKFDLVSGVISWSEEIFQMFGRDAQQGPPSYQEHTQSIDSGDRQRHQEIVDKVFQTGKPQDLTYRFYRQDGSQGWLWTKIEAIHNPDGEVAGLQGVAMDISSQKKAEAELERLNEELEERVLDRTEAFIQSETRLQEVNEQLKNRLQELKNRNDQMESLSILTEYLQSCVINRPRCLFLCGGLSPTFVS